MGGPALENGYINVFETRDESPTLTSNIRVYDHLQMDYNGELQISN